MSNQASTSIGTASSSDLQTGNLLPTGFSSEISELHSSPSPSLPSTAGIHAESDGLSPFSTDNGHNNHGINNARRSRGSLSRQSYGRNNESSDVDLRFYDRLLDLGDGLYGDSTEQELRSSHLRQYGSSGLSWHSRSRVILCESLNILLGFLLAVCVFLQSCISAHQEVFFVKCCFYKFNTLLSNNV
jgi:hypothetical protein